MSQTVIDLTKYKREQYNRVFKAEVTDILNYCKSTLRDNEQINTSNHMQMHILTTVITNICTWIIKSGYFVNPREILRQTVNNALKQADMEELK